MTPAGALDSAHLASSASSSLPSISGPAPATTTMTTTTTTTTGPPRRTQLVQQNVEML